MSDPETAEQYQRKGFLGRIGFGQRPALLIIDFVLGFTDPACPLGSNYDPEVEATRQLLEAARELRIPIVWTTCVYDKGAQDGGYFKLKVPSLHYLEVGSPWVEIDPRLAPQSEPNEHVIVKKYASAFFGTNVQSLLTSTGVDTVIITGCTTSGCVRASAVDALQYGFRPMVVRQAVGDRAAGPHEANLFDLDAKYADVVELDATLAYLRGLATPAADPARSTPR